MHRPRSRHRRRAHHRGPLVSLLICLGALCGASTVQAQYKVVDPSGRVTYTDRPQPAAGMKIEPLRAPGTGSIAGTATGGGGAAEAPDLPYELRRIAERYPVLLYTTDPCDACAAGRSLLQRRGIPFNEKTIRTDADRRAFQRADAGGELPLLRIGAQQLRGFAETEWLSYLDAAGYPRESRLQPGYRAPAPTALAPDRTAPPRADAAPQAAVPAALPPALEAAPNGIRF